MKALIAIALTAILLAACSPPREKAPQSPVLATVNGAPITARQFQDKLRFLRLGYSNISGRASSGMDAKMDLLSQMIDEEMCLQEARRVRITAGKQEVDARLGKVMADYKGAFLRTLKAAGVSLDEYREELGRKLTVEKLVEAQVYSRVSVDRAQALRYYQEHRSEFRQPARVRARQIVVDNPAEAKAILEELKKGADFSRLARSRSLSPDSASGGDLGYFSRGEMPPQFEAVVFRMKPGKTSGVVKTPYGYHIFKVEDVQKAHEMTFEEAGPGLMKTLAAGSGEEAYEKWQEALKGRTKIEVNFEVLGHL